jgi:hypothetical protein
MLSVSVPLVPVLEGAEHVRSYEVPSVVVASITFWMVTDTPSPVSWQTQATAKLLVPTGTEIVTAFDETVAAANVPEPIAVATAAGAAPLKLKVTAVGLLLPPPPPAAARTD